MSFGARGDQVDLIRSTLIRVMIDRTGCRDDEAVEFVDSFLKGRTIDLRSEWSTMVDECLEKWNGLKGKRKENSVPSGPSPSEEGGGF